MFRRENLFNWIGGRSEVPPFYFDIALMLRVVDIFSCFDLTRLTPSEGAVGAGRNADGSELDPDVLDPAGLISCNSHHRIQHTTKRRRTREGTLFLQLSLSDYFKALYMITGGDPVSGANDIYLPIRRCDSRTLILPDGRSLIDQLMQIACRLVIEDVDLTADDLKTHFAEFGLGRLRATDVSDRQRMRGASITLVERAD